MDTSLIYTQISWGILVNYYSFAIKERKFFFLLGVTHQTQAMRQPKLQWLASHIKNAREGKYGEYNTPYKNQTLALYHSKISSSL